MPPLLIKTLKCSAVFHANSSSEMRRRPPAGVFLAKDRFRREAVHIVAVRGALAEFRHKLIEALKELVAREQRGLALARAHPLPMQGYPRIGIGHAALLGVIAAPAGQRACPVCQLQMKALQAIPARVVFLWLVAV